MNSRERFLQTLSRGFPDRIPCFEEGIRDETLEAWQSQGLPSGLKLSKRFHFDPREELEPEMRPLPSFSRWPSTYKELDELRRRLDPQDPARLPEGWDENLSAWKSRQNVLMMRVHRGFFLSLGVDGWNRFSEVIAMTMDNPGLVQEILNIQGKFAAQLAERILKEIEVDAVIFGEPIGGSHGPLISPKMYERIMIPSLKPIFEVLERYEVKNIILRTYANTRVLIPCLVNAGINCLWACETEPKAMDYTNIRKELGSDLNLIAGVDLDLLREDRQTIYNEFKNRVIPLINKWGYIPLADGRVREDIPFRNYAYYRELLEKVTGHKGDLVYTK